VHDPIFRKAALEKAASPEQLDQLMQVTTPKGWLALLGLAGLLLAALLWSLFASVQLTAPGRGMLVPVSADTSSLSALLYVSLDDGARIRPGMPVLLSPASVRKEEFGLLRGTVAAVGVQPATQQEMARNLNNDAVAQALAAAGNLMEVRVRLAGDPTFPPEYQWTSGHPPPFALQAGTLASGMIVVSEQTPLSLVFNRR